MPRLNQELQDPAEALRRRILRIDIDGPKKPEPRRPRHRSRQHPARRIIADPDILLLKWATLLGFIASTVLSISGLIWTTSNILQYYEGIYYSSFWSIGFICASLAGYILTFGLLTLLDSKRMSEETRRR